MTIQIATAPQSAATIRIPGRLTPAVLELAEQPLAVEISPSALENVAACWEFVTRRLEDGTPVYDSITGLGPLVDFTDDTPALDGHGIIDHSAADPRDGLSPRVVRAAVLVRLWALTQGRSGVSVSVPRALAAMLRTDFAPAVPGPEPLWANGDLTSRYLADALRGYGHAYTSGLRLPAAEALAAAGLTPVSFDGRDRLALANNATVTVAAAGLALAAIRRSHSAAIAVTAVLIDLLGHDPGFLLNHLLDAPGPPDAAAASTRIRDLLRGTTPRSARSAREDSSLRGAAELLDSLGSSLWRVGTVVDSELNGIGDSPLFFPEHGTVVHSDNYFDHPIALVGHLLAMGTEQLGNLAERQLGLIFDPHHSGDLPDMVDTDPDTRNRLQDMRCAASATLATMRGGVVLPPTDNARSDGHNPDANLAGMRTALNALDRAARLRWLHGALAIALGQMVRVGGRRPTAPACAAILDALIEAAPSFGSGGPMDQQVRTAAAQLDIIADTLPSSEHS
ncbi:aromatic amino acid lyase [Nocardia sp. NPDC059091]|uniref:aromatic amino acid lyase n=1 Tax=unclassified Nocardia TaxID=2637762 RepID=UPI0036ACA9E7